MPAGSNGKRERQYQHIKASVKQRGESTDRAVEIAARTVDKGAGPGRGVPHGEPFVDP